MNVEINDSKHVHGKNLRDYAAKLHGERRNLFENIIGAYEEFRNTVSEINSLGHDDIVRFVNALNAYRSVAVPVFDKLNNAGQKALGYTVMEEFFFLLFDKKMRQMEINHGNLFVGKGNSYVSLSFTPSSFSHLFDDPNAYIHTKDQDFMLGANVDINIVADGREKKETTVIPVVAIECKTYLERNMLDSCAATAARLKSAMPYCIYIVAAEYMKMSDTSPELTDIDGVYILCKAKNADRERRKKNNEPPLNIDPELIFDLYERVSRHLNAIWWKPEDAVATGKIINRPI